MKNYQWFSRLWMGLVYFFLYLPIIVLVIFSFNKGRPTRWNGFTLDNYADLFKNQQVIDGLHQRRQFPDLPALRHGRVVAGRTLAQLLAQRLQRLQASRHTPPHQQHAGQQDGRHQPGTARAAAAMDRQGLARGKPRQQICLVTGKGLAEGRLGGAVVLDWQMEPGQPQGGALGGHGIGLELCQLGTRHQGDYRISPGGLQGLEGLRQGGLLGAWAGSEDKAGAIIQVQDVKGMHDKQQLHVSSG